MRIASKRFPDRLFHSPNWLDERIGVSLQEDLRTGDQHLISR
jgi:hypothetical protein